MASAQDKADIAGNLAQQKAAIAANLAEEKAAIAEASAQRLAAIAAEEAQQKAAIAANAAAQRAANAAALADQKAAIQSRLQQEKAVQQAILAAQKNAAEQAASFDKRAHDQNLALIKQETQLKLAEIKQIAAAKEAAEKRATAASKAAAAKEGGGPSVGGEFLKGLLPGAERLGTAAGIAGVAGGLIAEGASKLLGAAESLARSAASLIEAGVKLSIEQTSKREVQSAVFKQIGGDYEATVKLALNLGIDEADAVEQVKKLLHAGFSKQDIPALLKIKAGMDLAGFDADALFKKLETIKLEPKVKAKDVDGLAKLGVDTKKVYDELAKSMGTTVPVAMAKVKAGTADSAKVIAAIETVAGKSFGPLADTLGNSVPALLMKVKTEFFQLFDSVDLSPVKDFLKNVAAVLEGPGGKALKGSITELFSELNHALLDQFKGEEGKAKLTKIFTGIAAVIHDVAGIVKQLAPALELIGSLLATTGEQGTTGQVAIGFLEGAFVSLIPGLQEAIVLYRAMAPTVEAVIDLFGALSGAADALSFDSVIASAEALVDELLGFDLLGDGSNIGQSLVDGIVQGIEGGASAAIAAAATMASDALAAAKQALGVASPSAEFAKIGHFSGEGMAKGFAANDNATAAAGDMAGRALGAAQAVAGAPGAPGGAGGAGGKGGAGGHGITVIIQIGAGTSPAAVTAVAQLQPMIEAAVRRGVRDALEGRAA